MKFISAAIFAGLASAHVLARDSCDADNCARQVRVTVDGAATQAQRSQDCTTYLQATVVTTIGSGATTIFPSAIPTYASSCTVGGVSNFARYSSACVNCVGVNPSTTTILKGCNADLCSRGLFGTNVPVASVASNTDACKSFLLTTLSVSADVTLTVTPTDIPTAAIASCTPFTATPAPARFSSACVCAGFAPQTTIVS